MPGRGFRGRGGAAQRGRGGAQRGRGGGQGGHASKPVGKSYVAKPAIHELPDALQLPENPTILPSILETALPEFKKSQAYFSALDRLHPEISTSVLNKQAWWYGISGERLVGLTRESDSSFEASLQLVGGQTQPVFLKRIHLVDPMVAMEGDYCLADDGALPAASERWQTTLHKINDPMNEAYIDALFALYASKFVESGVSPHWCRCFGTFSARVASYQYNITEEYDSLRIKSWWKRNQRLGLFQYVKDEYADKSTQLLALDSKDLCDGDFDELDTILDVDHGATPQTEGLLDSPMVEEDIPLENKDHVKLTNPRLLLQRVLPDRSKSQTGYSGSLSESGSGSGSGSESGSKSGSGSRSGSDTSSDDDSSEDIVEQFVEFRNFPVQASLLERAEGTMDVLLDDENDDDPEMAKTKEVRWAAWLFQVIAGLIAAQHFFGFVHNDLHTNNVMWNTTEQEFIYYRVAKNKEVFYMKVPTFGRLMKIIDFGRASFTVPGVGFFISDAFFPGNDAATQYNCEPFYDASEGKRVEPNTSFDLARLAVSMIEALYAERPANAVPIVVASREGSKLYPVTVSPVYNLLWEWLTDVQGKNILRTPKGEERYPDFDLYRALAADVRNGVPANQVMKPVFQQFRYDGNEVAGARAYELILPA
jgi:serine/threonine protein kinase